MSAAARPDAPDGLTPEQLAALKLRIAEVLDDPAPKKEDGNETTR